MHLKRLLMLLTAFVILIGCLLPGAAEEAKTVYVMAGFDDTSMRQWESNSFFVRMKNWTGVEFSFRQYTNADAWRAFKAGLTAGESLPDVLFKASLSQNEQIRLRENGVLIDLKPYLEQYAPNLWAILQQNPGIMKAITLPDGSIAALPYINGLSAQNYIWINQQWLDTLRLNMPATAQELVDVLTAFRQRDPNRNGREDEIPLGFLGPFDLKFLAHAFGMICNDYNIFEENGQVRFMPLEENYRLFVTWCRDLYAAGLLDKNGFSTVDSLRQVTDDNAKPTYGAILTTAPTNLFQVSWSDQYTVMPPLTYNGRQIYRDFFGPVQRGTFAVTSACAHPEEMIAWVDNLYTERAAILASAGEENVDYLVDGDGTWRLLEAAQSSTASSIFIASVLMEGGGSMPGISAQDFMRRYSGQTSAYRSNYEKQMELQSVCVMPFPYFSLTDEQAREIALLQEKIGAYVDLQLGRWVLGEEEISDASFAGFEQNLNDLGLPAFLSFWQNVLDQQKTEE